MNALVLVSSLAAHVKADGTLGLTRKFLDGILEQQRGWGGPVVVVVEPAKHSSNNLDNVDVDPESLPFKIVVASFSGVEIEAVLKGAAVALLVMYQKHFHLARVCKRLGVPAVFLTEYTLRTRCQIISAQKKGFVWSALKYALELVREIKARRVAASASGLQCNGIPTFKAYRGLGSEAMLFFDTRVTHAMLATEQDLHRRFQQRSTSGVLRLAFSGRLIAMKGVDHLIDVAEHLRAFGRPFTMTICGDGEMRDALDDQIQKRNLGQLVKLVPTLDFETELIAFVREEVDLFVCCHIQGDPSCTYLETMSCGVPIIGYANEAFAGLHAEFGIGWKSPLGQPKALAERISKLTEDDIERQSRQSLFVASQHTFPLEFARRTAHLKRLSAHSTLE